MAADRVAESKTRAAWLSALRRYLVVTAIANLLWEFAHMPLYTIWNTGTWSQIVFAAIHCTGGDILIGLASLVAVLMLAGTPAWPEERFWAVSAMTIVCGLTYTVFSEHLNIYVRGAWAYSTLMPIISLGSLQVGASPLLQWIVIPALAIGAARSAAKSPTVR